MRNESPMGGEKRDQNPDDSSSHPTEIKKIVCDADNTMRAIWLGTEQALMTIC